MLHPSYSDLMETVNANVEEGETPIVNSRYSIVMATAKRARQIIEAGQHVKDGEVSTKYNGLKPLSTAVQELANGDIQILNEEA